MSSKSKKSKRRSSDNAASAGAPEPKQAELMSQEDLMLEVCSLRNRLLAVETGLTQKLEQAQQELQKEKQAREQAEKERETMRQKYNDSLDHLSNIAIGLDLKDKQQEKQQKGSPKATAYSEHLARLACRLNLILKNVSVETLEQQILAQFGEALSKALGSAVDVKLVALPIKEGATTRWYKILCGSMEVRSALLKAQIKLFKATGYRLDVDLTRAQQATRKSLKPVADRVKAAGAFWFFKGTALRVRTAPGEDEDATTWLAKKGGGSGTAAPA
jgi:hypothetical protein